MFQFKHTRLAVKSIPYLTVAFLLSACDDAAMSIDDNMANACCTYHTQSDENAVFALSEQTVHPETPFFVSLSIPQDAKVVSAKMSGVTMYMGTIPVMFEQRTATKWVAQIMLGSCSEPTMVWHLDVAVVNRDITSHYVYPVSVTHP